jgi:hypothetical protein
MINDLWYKNAVIYCLSVGTYMDSNGDGTGDFRGLMRRLDYLHGLGVTAIWLMPFQTSPCRDDGYDVSDYYNVDPRYGTLGDFIEFTHGAKQRGIRVLIDLVVNHTSDQHPWFKQALAFSAVPRSRKSGFLVASPAFSFALPFASSKPPLILSFVLDFIRTKSRGIASAVVMRLKLKAIAKTKKQKERESPLQSEQHSFLRRWLQARLEVLPLSCALRE